MTIALQALSLVEKAEPVQVRFTLHLRDQRSKWMQDGCKFYMDSYMASNASCFMVTWTIFQNPLLEVTLTPNRENMALRTLTNHQPSLVGQRKAHFPRSTKRAHDHTTWFWKVSWDGLWTLLWGPWLMCEAALNRRCQILSIALTPL